MVLPSGLTKACSEMTDLFSLKANLFLAINLVANFSETTSDICLPAGSPIKPVESV